MVVHLAFNVHDMSARNIFHVQTQDLAWNIGESDVNIGVHILVIKCEVNQHFTIPAEWEEFNYLIEGDSAHEE